MWISEYSSCGKECINVYLSKGETFEQYEEEIKKLNEDKQIFVFISGDQDFGETLVRALTDII